MHHPPRSDMAHPATLATGLVAGFRCTGAQCVDSCCAGWAIELDDATLRRYRKKRDLADSFELTSYGHTMRLDDDGHCVKHDDGWCGIQQRYGAEYLSDTCFFFPRSFKQLGDVVVVGASLSCPETARMALQDDPATLYQLRPYDIGRAVPDLMQRLPEGLPHTDAMEIYERTQEALQSDSLTAPQHLARLIGLAYAMEELELTHWLAATRFYLNMPPPSPAPPMHAQDALTLLHGIASVAIRDHSQYRPRLYPTLRDMEQALDSQLHWTQGTLDYHTPSTAAWQQVQHAWQPLAAEYDALLRRWLQAQVARCFFPVGGLTAWPKSDILALSIYFSTVRLAFMCATYRQDGRLEDASALRIIQSLARVFEHISDHSVYEQVYTQRHWQEESGLRGLCGA